MYLLVSLFYHSENYTIDIYIMANICNFLRRTHLFAEKQILFPSSRTKMGSSEKNFPGTQKGL